MRRAFIKTILWPIKIFFYQQVLKKLVFLLKKWNVKYLKCFKCIYECDLTLTESNLFKISETSSTIGIPDFYT